MRSIVFISLESWDEVWRRNQFICDELIKRHPDLQILFVEPSKDISNSLRRGRIKDIFKPAKRAPETHSRITCFSPIKWLPNSISWCRKINEFFYRRQVRKNSSYLEPWPLLWINAHSAVHLVGRLGNSGVVYDVTDDWTSFKSSEAEHKLTCQQDLLLCQKADAVIVCSQRLYEMKKKIHDRVYLIPNGVDAAHYSRVMERSAYNMTAKKEWESPVLGYVGTIHAERVNVELLIEIASQLTSGHIALVGPNYLDNDTQLRLVETGRIQFTGPVPYQDIPSWMSNFDVLLVPHVVSDFTESLNPIKLWEYLAAGKPIISTPVAGFRDFPEHVSLARTAAQFCIAIGPALTEARSAAEARQATARLHSWTDRVEKIESVVSSLKRHTRIPTNNPVSERSSSAILR